MDKFRTEHFIPILADRSSWDAWVQKGSKSLLARATEEVRRILKEHTVEKVRSEVPETAAQLVKNRSK